MNKTKLTYKVARKIYDSYRFLVANFKIKNLKKELNEKKIMFTLIIPKHFTLLDLTAELSTLKSISEIRDF